MNKIVLILLIHFCLSTKHRCLCIGNIKIIYLSSYIYISVFKNYTTKILFRMVTKILCVSHIQNLSKSDCLSYLVAAVVQYTYVIYL
jgi:hypothetical protein